MGKSTVSRIAFVVLLAACKAKSEPAPSSVAATAVPPTPVASASSVAVSGEAKKQPDDAPGLGLGPSGPLASSSVGDPPPRLFATGTAAATGGPAKPKSDMRFGATTVSGRMPPEVVQRVVRRDFTKIRACYDTALQRNPKLAGKIVVRFIISQDGNVTSASSEPETTLADATAVSCVVDQFKKLSFPQPEGGIVTVVYPLTFALADE